VGGRRFRLVKLRTMVADAEAQRDGLLTHSKDPAGFPGDERPINKAFGNDQPAFPSMFGELIATKRICASGLPIVAAMSGLVGGGVCFGAHPRGPVGTDGRGGGASCPAAEHGARTGLGHPLAHLRYLRLAMSTCARNRDGSRVSATTARRSRR
jgi:hypothetical protein